MALPLEPTADELVKLHQLSESLDSVSETHDIISYAHAYNARALLTRGSIRGYSEIFTFSKPGWRKLVGFQDS